MHRLGIAICVTLLVCFAASAEANMPPPPAEPAPEPLLPPPGRTLPDRVGQCSGTVCLPGRWLFQYTFTERYNTDAEGHESPIEHAGRQVIRMHPMWNIIGADDSSGPLTLHGELDVMTGRTFGDLNTVATSELYDPEDRRNAWADPSPHDYRQLYLSWRSPAGVLRVGQQTSKWGLGVIANDGEDQAHDVFDAPRAGDLTERVLFATAPFGAMSGDWAKKLLLAGGFDVVYRDENASLVDGDLALGGVVSLVYRDLPRSTDPWAAIAAAGRDEERWGFEAGVYVAIRDQEDRDGDTLAVRAYDLFARGQWEIDEGLLATAGVELVFVEGNTSRVALEQAPDGVDIAGLGAVLQLALLSRDLGVEARLEAGYASGDNDRTDGVSRSFSFDPDYHVGMILFQEVMARISAQSIENAQDPEVLERPAKGLELVASDGSVQNAWYLNPVLRWRHECGVGVDLGILVAWSDADFADPWQSALNGGFNTNYVGRSAGSHFLGTELDLGLRYDLILGERVWASVFAQGGAFLPGHAFDAPNAAGPTLGTVMKLRTGVELGW